MKTQQIWLKNKQPIKPEDTVLLCFPFAGGGASAYYSWYDKLPEDIVLCPVQLPGREDRFKEPPYLSMDHLRACSRKGLFTLALCQVVGV